MFTQQQVDRSGQSENNLDGSNRVEQNSNKKNDNCQIVGTEIVSSSLLQLFRLEENERCYASYACSLERTILLSGRLYLFQNWICFHSYFNSKTLFGATVLVLLPDDVLTIKKSKVYLCDNAIEIQTRSENLVFASFFDRNETYDLLKRNLKEILESSDEVSLSYDYLYSDKTQQELPQYLEDQYLDGKYPTSQWDSQQLQPQQIKDLSIQNAQTLKIEPLQLSFHEQNVIIQQELKIQEQEQEHNDSVQNFLYQDIMINKKQERIMNQSKITKWTVELPISVKEVTEKIFVGSPYVSSEGEQFGSFFEYFQLYIGKDRELDMQPYQPIPKVNSLEPSKRTISFIHPVRDKVMFAPDSVTCIAQDTIYLFNDEEMLQEKELSFSKIPYGDSFRFLSYFYLKAQGEGCIMEYGFQLEFMKKTIWMGQIESRSKSENIESWGILRPLIIREAEKIYIEQQKQKEIYQDVHYNTMNKLIMSRMNNNTIQTFVLIGLVIVQSVLNE